MNTSVSGVLYKLIIKFVKDTKWMLGRVGVENPEQWLEGMYARAQDRAEWRRLVKGFSLLEPRAAPAQRASPYPSRARREGGPS